MGSKAKTKEIREYVLDKVDHYPKDISQMIQGRFMLTKQGAYYHLDSLVKDGLLDAEGLRKGKLYRQRPMNSWQRNFELDGLSEGDIWDQIVESSILPELDQNRAGYTLMYGFTEMLNNAIDHSEGTQASVTIQIFHSKIVVIISDNGVGIFKKIQREENLEGERHAILLLSKGKYTSMPEAHSGQGIFFTSKAFDFFDIVSGGICFIHERESHNDWVLDSDYSSGTQVIMSLAINSHLNMESLFGKFASSEGDYVFDTTVVPVKKLKSSNESVVSRSQAKRLMVGLQKFSQVWLDFDGVERIGQAFADEVFRVWASRNPMVMIHATNENVSVKRMIEKALTDMKEPKTLK